MIWEIIARAFYFDPWHPVSLKIVLKVSTASRQTNKIAEFSIFKNNSQAFQIRNGRSF